MPDDTTVLPPLGTHVSQQTLGNTLQESGRHRCCVHQPQIFLTRKSEGCCAQQGLAEPGSLPGTLLAKRLPPSAQPATWEGLPGSRALQVCLSSDFLSLLKAEPRGTPPAEPTSLETVPLVPSSVSVLALSALISFTETLFAVVSSPFPQTSIYSRSHCLPVFCLRSGFRGPHPHSGSQSFPNSESRRDPSATPVSMAFSSPGASTPLTGSFCTASKPSLPGSSPGGQDITLPFP